MSHEELIHRIDHLEPQHFAALEQFVEFLHRQSKQKPDHDGVRAASAAALEAVWNNPEDDVYDSI